MFESFLAKFKITARISDELDKGIFAGVPNDLFELFRLMGGATFAHGIYRIHTPRSSLKWSIQLAEYFPVYKNQIFPFAFDWLARQYCIDRDNQQVFLFDPATVEDFKLKKDLLAFHDEDVSGDLFAADFFNDICSFQSIKSLEYSNCLGHKIPLFLNAKDEVENYAKQDIEVYWHFQTQLYNQVKNLPEGTKIGNIKLER